MLFMSVGGTFVRALPQMIHWYHKSIRQIFPGN